MKEYCTGCGGEMIEMPLKGAEEFFSFKIHFGSNFAAYDEHTGKRRMFLWVKCKNEKWWNLPSTHSFAHVIGKVILVGTDITK